jgi:hypothetical protein
MEAAKEITIEATQTNPVEDSAQTTAMEAAKEIRLRRREGIRTE